MFFSFYFVVRSWRQYADTQCGIAKSLARTSSRQFITKTRKTKYNHANAYVKEMNKHISQNDTTRHRTRDTMWETNEETCKQQADPVQNHSAKKSTKRHHAGDKCKRMHSDLLENDPSQCAQQRKPCGRLHWKVIRARQASGQETSKKIIVWKRMKGNESTHTSENDPAKRAGEQSSLRQTSGRHIKEIKAHTLKMILPPTPRKQSFGRQMKGN